MNSPEEKRVYFDALVDEAISLNNTVLRNVEMDYDEHGRPKDGIDRVRQIREYLAAYEDEDPKVMAMAVAGALDMITEERIKYQH